jgi:hypothetical protein
MHNTSSTLPVAIVGAGPIGLAAAAHLVARGLPFVIFEAGASAGHHLDGYRHVRLFSPWRYNVDRAATALLEDNGWVAPDPDVLPTAGEVVDDYLVPLARDARIAPHLHFGARVVAISRVRHDKVKSAQRDDAPFVVQVERKGTIEEHRARAVVDASGTWSQPNPLGAHGLPVPGEREHAARIVHGMPDIAGAERARYANRKVLVVGAGHSAIGNLVALATVATDAPDTRIAWALRRTDLSRVVGGGENDGLPARGALGLQLQKLIAEQRLEIHPGFHVGAIEADAGVLRVVADDPAVAAIEGIDEIIVATGSRPDLSLSRELRMRLDPLLESTDALAPLIDPNVHSCGTVRPHGHRELAHPEAGFYAIGAKSYGRAPNFLMATGYEQARSVVAALAGDLVAADDVQLELPVTGVCSSDFTVDPGGRVTDCCGGPPQAGADACCVADEDAKAASAEGCGCPTSAPAASKQKVKLPGIKVVAEQASCCAPVA